MTAYPPPAGALPVLQYLVPAQLAIDATYQRGLETAPSQALVRRIAQGWDWSLCQPLVVARRAEGYFVIDGQHRLAAAKLRGDLQVLPCVVVDYASPQAEAAAFVALNRQRRPLSALDIFRAAVASGDPQARAIEAAIAAAGLRLTTHTNNQGMEPGSLGNIAGIQRAWRDHGPAAASLALQVLAAAFAGQVLRYAGTIYPGIAAILAEDAEDFPFLEQLIEMLASRPQADWFAAVTLALTDEGSNNRALASCRVLSDAWDEALGAHLAGELEGAA